MSTDPFVVLGLTPGRYEPAEITRRFAECRQRLLRDLHAGWRYDDARRELDELYVAFRTLLNASANGQAARPNEADRYTCMRRLIAASLEGGLLRASRRERLLEEGRRRGFADFHTHLLITQVQAGEGELLRAGSPEEARSASQTSRVGARVAAAGLLGLAIFLTAVRWLNL